LRLGLFFTGWFGVGLTFGSGVNSGESDGLIDFFQDASGSLA